MINSVSIHAETPNVGAMAGKTPIVSAEVKLYPAAAGVRQFATLSIRVRHDVQSHEQTMFFDSLEDIGTLVALIDNELKVARLTNKGPVE